MVSKARSRIRSRVPCSNSTRSLASLDIQVDCRRQGSRISTWMSSEEKKAAVGLGSWYLARTNSPGTYADADRFPALWVWQACCRRYGIARDPPFTPSARTKSARSVKDGAPSHCNASPSCQVFEANIVQSLIVKRIIFCCSGVSDSQTARGIAFTSRLSSEYHRRT